MNFLLFYSSSLLLEFSFNLIIQVTHFQLYNLHPGFSFKVLVVPLVIKNKINYSYFNEFII